MSADLANSVGDLWYRLGFLSAADLNAATWVTPTDLYKYGDEAVKRLAYVNGMFKTWDNSIPVNVGTALVNLPAGHVFTVFAFIAYGETIQMLRLTNVEQLFAFDSDWTTRTGYATRLSLDAGGTGTATFYPVSAYSGGVLWQVFQQTPPTVQAGASVVPVPAAAGDYFTYAMLAIALQKESDYARPEVAAHCLERMALYEKVFEHYFGPGA